MLYIHFFKWLLLIILINIKRKNGSLLSRFRNPNEYVPRDAGKYFFPEDIDEDLYADLLQEVPELKGKLRRNQNDMQENTMLPFIRHDLNGSFDETKNMEDFDTAKDEDQEEYPGQLDYMTVAENLHNITSITQRLPFLSRWSLNYSERLARRKQNMRTQKFHLDSNSLRIDLSLYPRISTCYWCGLNYNSRIPLSPLCHDAFESEDWRAKTLARYFRAHCHKAEIWHENIKPYDHSKYAYYHYDNGLIRRKYGPYKSGCFKNFLDVGKVYTQRGCRSEWPHFSHNFASHRFRRLESLIREEKEYCIVSPHASLTPFSRGISLYVRYHVCVCEKRYCNISTRLQYTLSLIITASLVSNFMSS